MVEVVDLVVEDFAECQHYHWIVARHVNDPSECLAEA